MNVDFKQQLGIAHNLIAIALDLRMVQEGLWKIIHDQEGKPMVSEVYKGLLEQDAELEFHAQNVTRQVRAILEPLSPLIER